MTMQKARSYTIDLTKIKGSGKVKCPKCGTEISPDDTSEERYTILKPVVEEVDLKKIVLQCNMCRSRINLVGFDLLNRRTATQN